MKRATTCPHSDFPTPAGEYLREVLTELGMNETEAAERVGCSTKMMHDIIMGKIEIGPVMARTLEFMTGVASHVWLHLEHEARIAKEQ